VKPQILLKKRERVPAARGGGIHGASVWAVYFSTPIDRMNRQLGVPRCPYQGWVHRSARLGSFWFRRGKGGVV